VPVSTKTGIRRDTGPPFEPHMLALPLSRKPLFPGQQQLLQVTHPLAMKAVTKMLESGNLVCIGAFVRRSESPLEGNVQVDGQEDTPHPEDFSHTDPLEALYRTGTRARVVQAAPFVMPSGKGPVEGINILLHGQDLIHIDKVLNLGPPLQVQVSRIQHKSTGDTDEIKAYINETMHTVREIMKINPQFREHASLIHQGLERLERSDAHAIAHFAASLTTASGADLMQVLEEQKPAEKLRFVLYLVKKELELSQLQHKISSQIEEKVSSTQREFMLREQMKMIKKELGEDKSDGSDAILKKFKQRLEDKIVAPHVQEAIDSEMEKFSNLAKESQEYQITRSYLDWLTVLPWGVYDKDTLSLRKARTILDRDHYGLTDVKQRILELIAVGTLRGTVQGKIICFVGPPGVGKTSIGRSIAQALGREFYRFSVGGLYDVAEIKGHRRTYVGAMPGKIIQCLKQTQKSNPLILIDEVDKMGQGRQGDPASALLELLDPSQNTGFLDHYLDVPVDCSKILFVCTANVSDTIPGPLLDRMEVIRLSGYDLQEKVKIAEDYLVPSAMRDVGLWPPVAPKQEQGEKAAAPEVEPKESVQGLDAPAEVSKSEEVKSSAILPGVAAANSAARTASIDSGAVESLIRWYCREAGVRNLQKHIEKICRKLTMKVVEAREAAELEAEEQISGKAEVVAESPAEDVVAGASAKEAEAEKARDPPSKESTRVDPSPPDLDLHVTEEKLSNYVGKPLFTSDRLYEGQLPAGTVTGLAWTALGGSVLYMEATSLPRPAGKAGAPSLNVTGQLGSVMKESSQLALLLARRQLASLAPESRKAFFEENELHLHCPEGATPKDGPSAGVTMVTALLSLSLDMPVRTDLAMTGEISLNGKVLAVGGIKEKTIAARRAGCKALVYPQANQRDFDELPDYLRDGLEVKFATTYEDVFDVAFPGFMAGVSSKESACAEVPSN